MENDKFYIRAITILLLCVTLISGCGHSANTYDYNSKDPTKITIWHYYNGAQAIADYETIEQQIAGGISREEALAPYLTETYFDEWYKGLKSQMDKLCTE